MMLPFFKSLPSNIVLKLYFILEDIDWGILFRWTTGEKLLRALLGTSYALWPRKRGIEIRLKS